ncbi:hypothetical protein ROE7235_03690 [Roseibaca ekhonensis]|jgi:hypothetical protein|uniref:Uncharacterized protein n=1 Tax=Roseinatronobacter ekhonensis TaxID=254356 RepID=A0A3B0MVX2_9RHOB|nr:hypothetical protein [Roseibaca ekhonensis]SUZ33909.1 hypothetical protein ROE7235_03690 [Roseibaca ekhonensis]
MQATQLLKLAETLAAHTDKKVTTLGVYSVNDGKFFERIKRGGGCTLKTASRVTEWFAENWPDDLTWPSDIPRPEAASKSKTSRRVA